MGGLICRCLIQKIIPEKYPERKATDFVESLFTYGTPHGGIEFDVGFGMIERLRDMFGIAGAQVFGPRRMYSYLTPNATEEEPPKGWRANDMPDGAVLSGNDSPLVQTGTGASQPPQGPAGPATIAFPSRDLRGWDFS
jgi:hypothetical protein